jgi:glycosyltransferase involved in cell wall biosynthesis
MIASKSHSSPIVSVVLPVKNGAQYIGGAIDSILNQTFADFELIIIDDGSDDGTEDIVQNYLDPRIRLVSQENQGVSKAANHGFALAKGKYITRHDHDDLSMPTRLEKQVRFLEDHPECGLVGSWAKIWSGEVPTGRVHRHPTSPGEIAFALLFNAPFVNASCLFRKEVLDWSGGYTEDENRMPPEDYEFFSRIAQKFDLANLPEYLMIYREVPNSQSSSIRSEQISKKESFVSHLALFSAENLEYANTGNVLSPSMDAHHFGCLVHGYLQALKEPINIASIQDKLSQAAKALSIRFREPSILKTLYARQQFLEYQYHTYMGNTYHWTRLQYLLFNRSFIDNFGSLARLVNRAVGYKVFNQ